MLSVSGIFVVMVGGGGWSGALDCFKGYLVHLYEKDHLFISCEEDALNLRDYVKIEF